jgi:esterase/lipase superfamily enzyme
MNIEYHKWWSQNLDRDMELKIYGQMGKPILIFPSMNGRFYEYEDFGMVDAVNEFIEKGSVQLFTVDSVDGESWTNWNVHPAERARRHEQYDRYIIQEVIPFINDKNQTNAKVISTGCSMGGYHAINFFFRHPDAFDVVIALSGIAKLNMFIGDFMDENVYSNSPILYLQDLTDEKCLNLYRQSRIILCAGQGAWEEPMIDDMQSLEAILKEKNVPCWLDLWGNDVVHDWPWWRKQLPYFLDKLGY